MNFINIYKYVKHQANWKCGDGNEMMEYIIIFNTNADLVRIHFIMIFTLLMMVHLFGLRTYTRYVSIVSSITSFVVFSWLYYFLYYKRWYMWICCWKKRGELSVCNRNHDTRVLRSVDQWLVAFKYCYICHNLEQSHCNNNFYPIKCNGLGVIVTKYFTRWTVTFWI